MRLVKAIGDNWLAQRGHLFGWVPVGLSIGIGAYFGLRFEPQTTMYVWLLAVAVVAVAGIVIAGAIGRPLWLFVLMIVTGVGLSGARAHLVAEPILTFRYYGPIEGRVIEVDRSASNAVRITLDHVRLDRMSPLRTPAHVRVSLHGDQQWLSPEPGMTVMLTGHLSPPSGPAEPGGFDFRRMAWFERLGAVGYTRTPVLLIAPATDGVALARFRAQVSLGVQDRIEGDPGGFAAAIMTGDRSGLSPEASEAMRVANLYHLVSISGMHMGMLAAFVFGVVRYGVALVPRVALRLSSRKVAALVALPIAAAYLALAGRAIPTERAFIMVAVMLVAILLDRRALSIRSVAIAALIVLVLRPESLLNPGFQMSFSAVVALVFAFGNVPALDRGRVWYVRLVWPAIMLLFSSLVAGTATAPYAAAHFNRVAHYGLLANLLAVPVMGFVVMPGAVMAAVLAPFGLEAPALWLVEQGSAWILWVAQTVAGWDGASSTLPQPPGIVLPLLTLGACFVVLWQGRTRLAGVVPVAAALVLWMGADRPKLLVADSGALLGLLTVDGRALSKPRGDGFVASVWLENDGAPVLQETAFARPGFDQAERRTWTSVAGLDILHVTGTRARDAIVGCDGADILIANTEIEDTRPCEVYDINRLRQTGALAIWDDPEGPRLVTAREQTGWRIWHGATARD